MKQTRAGEIPEDWSVSKIGEVAEVQGGIQKGRKPQANSFPVRYLTVAHVSGGKVTNSGRREIDVTEKELERLRLAVGDLLLVEGNGNAEIVGRPTIFDQSWDKCVFQNHLIRVRANSDQLHPIFLHSFLLSHRGRYQIRTEVVSSSGLHTISVGRIRSLPIPLPPLPEQRKIADILSTWDEALEKLDDLIKAKQKQKQGLMQQLLTGKKRLPGFGNDSGKNRIKIKFATYPGDWRPVSVGEVTNELSDRNSAGEVIPVLSSTKHSGLVYSEEYFGKKVFANDTTKYRVVPRGSFAYATNHIEEGSIGYQDLCDVGLVSPIYTVFDTTSEIHDPFLWRVLKSPLFLHHYRVNTNASVDRRGSLRFKEFAKIPLAIPSFDEQQAIASVLDTADQEISLLEQKRDAIDDQKRGLMQQLLTGKVRVKVEEEAA